MGLYALTAVSVCGGFLLDCLLGDPLSRAHPVVLMGKLISFLEEALRPRFPKTPGGERTAGTILAMTVPLLSAGIGWLLLYLAWRIHPWVYFVLSAFLCWQCFAARCLMTESKKVVSCLEKEGLDAGRRQVAMLVGRDTERLTEEQVIKATVETVAENTSDGVVAPLCWMILFGAVGGLFYKAVNTMDSMVGYKNDRYLYFGRTAAKLDDGVNYVPARLSALAMVSAAYLLKLDGPNAWRIWRRDRRNHASPNSAQTESVCAGALGVQLGGNASYFGKLYKKPTIGDPRRAVERADIDRACILMYGTSGLLFLAYGLILLLGGVL
ncbi:MAG: cobalamin biosynthesis protein CobD [Clostridia bacterium]|nr:cobalamin biosynthesis protein CobD [Clostridia bacterium]